MSRPVEGTVKHGDSSTPHPDHPLSPASHPGHAYMSRRVSSNHNTPGYFDADDTRRASETGNRGRRSTNSTEADLLGVGPSRRLGKSAATPSSRNVDIAAGSTSMERTRSRRSWRVFLQSLSKEELAVIETNFDDMSDEQLQAYIDAFDASSAVSSPEDALTEDKGGTPDTGDIPADPPPYDGAEAAGPLFPPSPPGETKRLMVDHPLRLLSRAVRELREVVENLEEENEKLRLLKQAGGVTNKRRDRQADQASIHEGLTEALATSLDTERAHIEEHAPSLRSTSPGPSLRRGKSPAPSVRTMPAIPSSPAGASSLYSVKSAEPPGTVKKATNGSTGRSSWTSGLWVWSGTKQSKPRARRGSVTSVKSQAGTLGNVVENQDYDDTASPAGDTDEQTWRKGDGGSSPSFRAIFLATRIITPDPASILVSSSIPSTSLVAYLAHALVSTARDEGILAKEPPGRRRGATITQSRSRAASIASTAPDSNSTDASRDNHSGKGYSDQALAATASLGRSLLSSVSNATIRAKAYTPTHDDSVPTRPSLLSRASSSRPALAAVTAVPVAPQISHVSSHSSTEDGPTLPSVEMASIVPDENRPPTVLLSRRQLGSFFQSSKAVPTLRTATRFSGAEPPLTDRYGFIYDIHHTSMLKDASDAGTAAPAPLNGTFHATRETEEEGWIDRHRRKSQDERPAISRSSTTSSTEPQVPSPRRSTDSTARIHVTGGQITPSKDRSSSHPDVKRLRGASSVSMNPSPPRTVTAKETVTVSTRGSFSLHSRAHTEDTPTRSPGSASLTLPLETSEPEANSSRLTVSSLLDRLTSLHDLQQKERKAEWDDYLRHRRGKTNSKVKARDRRDEDMASTGPGLIRVSEMGRGEEWKSFLRLVRGGIPLSYRSDVWAECSGAKDMMVPGEYAEIQTVHRDDSSPFLGEIEKDVTRTFPGNIYFGGDGPGVAKLRRVLVAYSWYNPEVGYCQGMNMLAATLLLTHTDEEQAYWTLISILSRILPSGYYTPDLLSSRADQLVLAELVVLYVPKVHAHFEELGVDLSSITFGWFLSLFTDCLPVETLFRVWDVFFVEGHDTLFRIAIAILKMHEADICACDSVSDLFTLMSTMTSRLWAADKLIALQHAYKPILKHSDITARCERRRAELSAQAGDA